MFGESAFTKRIERWGGFIESEHAHKGCLADCGKGIILDDV